MVSVDFLGLRAHWVDLAMLLWLVVSMLVGLARGLVFEMLSLIGWGVAYFAALWAACRCSRPTLAVGRARVRR